MAKRMPRIAAVIVTYEPDMELLCQVVERAAAQTTATVVVDNSETCSVSSLVKSWAARIENLVCIASGGNIGLGAAQNRGIQWATANGCEAVLLLDQDSSVGDGMADRLAAALDSASKAGKVAAVGPRYVDTSGRKSFFVRFGVLGFHRRECSSLDDIVQVDFLVSSGSLIRLDALNDIGLMDAGLFIDHIDTDWCLRARAKGYRLFGVCGATMSHSIGEPQWSGRLNFGRLMPSHSPLRQYYVFRNSVLLYRRPYAVWNWIVADIRRLVRLAIMYLLFSSRRWERLLCIVGGVRDGLLNRAGRR